jgi:hypothetical protein
MATKGGEWPKWYLLWVMQIDEYVAIFGFGGPGRHFFGRAIARLSERDADELFAVIVGEKEFLVAAEWDVIAAMCRQFPQMDERFREMLPFKERPDVGDPETMAALDVVFRER